MVSKLSKVLCGVLCGTLLIAGVPAYALSDSNNESEANTPKDEVIYANLDRSGSVKDVEVVNIYDTSSNKNIVDYGQYTGVENLTTEDKVSYAGEKITATSSQDKLYVEGKCKSSEIPWNISAKYRIDGKEMTYDEACDKSGNCVINFDITKNDAFDGNFFDGMFLQATVALSTNKISNIESDGATIANVGENKQLSYIILPGDGKNIEIQGEASSFGIESISINAIDMNLALSFNSTEIKDKVADLNEAISKIDDGAGDLSDGAMSLSSSISALGTYLRNAKSGVGSAASASASLAQGSSELVSKGQDLKSASNALFTSVCAQAGNSINAKLAQVGMPSVSLNSSNYSQVISVLIAQLQNVAAGNPDMAGSISVVVAELQATNAQLSSIDTFNSAVSEYVAGVEKLDGGQQQLNAGLNDLNEGLENLCNAFDKLDGGAGDLSTGAKTLSDGTGELLENTDGMDEEIDSEIQAKIDELTAKDIKCGSFASIKNDNINSVQFVMKLDVSNNDSQNDATTDDKESTTKTFWEKLLALFGIE